MPQQGKDDVDDASSFTRWSAGAFLVHAVARPPGKGEYGNEGEGDHAWVVIVLAPAG